MKRTLIGLALLTVLALGAVASATTGASKDACSTSCPVCTKACCASK